MCDWWSGVWFPWELVRRHMWLSSDGRCRPSPPSWWWLAGRRWRRQVTPLPPHPPPPPPPCQQRCPCETHRTVWKNGCVDENWGLIGFNHLLQLHHPTSRSCFFFYLHRVDDDGEGRVVPLAAALLRSTPGTFTTAMDGANSEHTEDHHDNQETHTHHYDNGGCSWHHCKKKQKNTMMIMI